MKSVEVADQHPNDSTKTEEQVIQPLNCVAGATAAIRGS